MRVVYRRKVPLSGWSTRLNWIKSGGKSLAIGTPYEIYEKRYRPDMLVMGDINSNIVLDLGSELRDILRAQRFHPDHTIRASVTSVVGRELDTFRKARKAWRGAARKATVHTQHFRLQRLNLFLADLHQRLDYLAELASKPAWLVAVEVAIYFEEGEVDLIKQSGVAEVVT